MPIYEYQCSQCGETMEKLQSSSSSPAPETCPSCGESNTLSRIMSQTSFQLKGGGWYVTDYKSSKKSEPAPTPSGSEPAKESTPAPKAEPAKAKSAGKKET